MNVDQAPPGFDEDALFASVDLIGRTGARNLDFGYLRDDVPVDQADWWASVTYKGTKVAVEHHADPIAAVETLARRLLSGAMCTHCGGVVALTDGPVDQGGPRTMADGSTWSAEQLAAAPRCRWRRVGNKWRRGCEMGPRRSGKGKRKKARR